MEKKIENNEPCKGCNHEARYNTRWPYHTCGKDDTPDFTSGRLVGSDSEELELTRKLHEWQWEACREELPRKHGKTPTFESLGGNQVRILRNLADKILSHFATREAKAREHYESIEADLHEHYAKKIREARAEGEKAGREAAVDCVSQYITDQPLTKSFLRQILDAARISPNSQV